MGRALEKVFGGGGLVGSGGLVGERGRGGCLEVGEPDGDGGGGRGFVGGGGEGGGGEVGEGEEGRGALELGGGEEGGGLEGREVAVEKRERGVDTPPHVLRNLRDKMS